MKSEGSASQLAINGGPKVRTDPWPPRGLIGAEEKNAVNALFNRVIAERGAITYGGPEEEAYCREFAETMDGGFADAVNSGTSAIYVALKALGVEPFTEVIVSAVTDPGGMMPIPLLNCIPMVADSAPGSYNSGPDQIEPLLSPRTSAIVVSHIGGEAADMTGILELAEKHHIPVIEDCAQAHGAKLHNRPLGTFGRLSAFSTMFGKHHSTGGQGGLVFTRDEDLYQRIRRAADRGKPVALPPGSSNCTASLNLNMSELAAAIGRVQLRRLPGITERRRAVAKGIAEGTRALKLVSIPQPIEGAEPSYWFLRVRFHPEVALCDKETFCRALIAEGLPINPAYRAALPHKMDWFRNRRVFGTSGYPWASPDYKGDREAEFPTPNAEAVMETQSNLAIHENWTEKEIQDCLGIFRKVEAAYAKG